MDKKIFYRNHTTKLFLVFGLIFIMFSIVLAIASIINPNFAHAFLGVFLLIVSLILF